MSSQRLVRLSAAALTVGIGLVGCSAVESSSERPAIIEISHLDGANVMLVVGQQLDIGTSRGSERAFAVTIVDDQVVEYVAPKKSGAGYTHPRLEALRSGLTDVYLTDGKDGSGKISFTVHVR